MNLKPSRAIHTTLLLLACAIAACGGGSGPAPSPAGIQAPKGSVDPGFRLAPTAIKSFRFSWNDAAGETGYRLLEDPDGASGYTPIASLPADTTGYEHEVFLPERVNARYLLQTCQDRGCVDTAELRVNDALAPAIGYLKASAAADDDQFGRALAFSADGQFLAIGAPGRSASSGSGGMAYVFARAGAGWRQQAVLTEPMPRPGNLFGLSLALSADGGTLAVGAPRGSGQVDFSGVAYVFTRTGDSWGFPVQVEASNAGLDDNFGYRITLSGDGNTLAVGADGESSDANTIDGPDNDNLRQSGAAYVFARVGGGWAQQAYLKASNSDAFDMFGRALSLSADGQTLAVGAIHESSSASGVGGDPNDNTAVASGAVYVFSRSLNTWSQQAYVKASNAVGGAQFGNALALSANGGVMAVGSRNESNGTRGIDGDQASTLADRSGAVYVFSRSGTLWGQQAYLKASNTEERDQFGAAVALSSDGDTLVVGAPGEGGGARGVQGDQDDNGAPGSGAAYLFRRSAAGWRQLAYLKPSNTVRAQVFSFGEALALSGGIGGPVDPPMTLAVGCPYASNASSGIGGDQTDAAGSDVGAVYLY